eukprot:CAMPEP_0194310988 /NCGR_PEP_ID=MMETSP0171-20130528/7964_1 /TAXON_ID=218684 /ORGANISM="Corethron pennatum, Strain L29A3" /LENGTH=33 /DNA_ID= /DNA_START= /DNA_END= /DNA_ORIENTATION=
MSLAIASGTSMPSAPAGGGPRLKSVVRHRVGEL